MKNYPACKELLILIDTFRTKYFFQMVLPENIERQNTKVYEEVNIPPSDPAPTHVGKDRVRIDQLDDVS